MGLPKALTWRGVEHLQFHAGPNAAILTAPNVTVFIAPPSSEWELVLVEEVHETLGTDGGAVTLDVVKCTGTQAAVAGTTMLLTTFNLKATINTVVRKSKSLATLTATAANRRVSAGQRIALAFGGTLTAVTGVHVDLYLVPSRRLSF